MKSIAILAVTLLAAGCAEEKTTFPENPPPRAAAPRASTAPLESPSFSAETQNEVNEALDAYDDIRGALSNDATEGVGQNAARLEAAATRAASQAGPPANGRLSAIAIASSKVKSASGLEPTRAAFAELSRAIIDFLSGEPSLAQSRYRFTCPMTKGYPRWVQSTEAIGNPYMGRKMLTCGEAEAWE